MPVLKHSDQAGSCESLGYSFQKNQRRPKAKFSAAKSGCELHTVYRVLYKITLYMKWPGRKHYFYMRIHNHIEKMLISFRFPFKSLLPSTFVFIKSTLTTVGSGKTSFGYRLLKVPQSYMLQITVNCEQITVNVQFFFSRYEKIICVAFII